MLFAGRLGIYSFPIYAFFPRQLMSHYSSAEGIDHSKQLDCGVGISKREDLRFLGVKFEGSIGRVIWNQYLEKSFRSESMPSLLTRFENSDEPKITKPDIFCALFLCLNCLP